MYVGREADTVSDSPVAESRVAEWVVGVVVARRRRSQGPSGADQVP